MDLHCYNQLTAAKSGQEEASNLCSLDLTRVGAAVLVDYGLPWARDGDTGLNFQGA
jgi:hypothetical protein